MKIADGLVRLSASDVANHLGCEHLTALDLKVAGGELKRPPPLPGLEGLRERGYRHEAEYLTHLRAQGLTVLELPKELSEEKRLSSTLEAMRAGVEVIAQGALLSPDGRWYGMPDVLRRVGDLHYEPYDTKLSSETKASAILQLCLYADLLQHAQGRLPERIHVVPPGAGFAPDSHRTADYLAYFRAVRSRLLEAIAARPRTAPEPTERCDSCQWWSKCRGEWVGADHLSLVAGATRLQRRELEEQQVNTLAQLAELPIPLPFKPKRGSAEALVRSRNQARIQHRGRVHGRPEYELLAQPRGFALLPEPSPGDVFFDLEGDPFVEEGGLEYLFGWAFRDEAGAWKYERHWALNRAEEKAAFEAFLDFVLQRMERFPDLHVYHFAPYEPSTLKRLMGRYAVRGDDVDRLLREERFVDLLAVVRRGLRASVESYSIKSLEAFTGYARTEVLTDAGRSRRIAERAVELGELDALTPEIRASIERYNADDCLSARDLRDWLEARRAELPEPPPRPPLKSREAPESDQAAGRTEAAALAARLLDGIPLEGRSKEQQARWLLAHLLEYFAREEKTAWWEFFRLSETPEAELLDEPAGLAGLEFQEELPRATAKTRVPTHRYRFPPQEVDIRKRSDVYPPGARPKDLLGKVERVDIPAGTIDLKKSQKTAQVHPSAVFTHLLVRADTQEKALLRLGRWVEANGIDAPGPFRAARDLLLARPPRPGTVSDDLPASVLALDGDVLAVQGPPGAGKTRSGAELIVRLVAAGKRVGVSAVSHKVITNLLQEVLKRSEGRVRAGQRIDGEHEAKLPEGLKALGGNDVVAASLRDGKLDLVGGTSFLWSSEALFESLDVLVVDEAGQLSLANTVAAAQAAKSLVLLGDPRQLEQPQKGSHPDGADVSALEHLLAGAQTIPRERGVFLGQTYRLAPALARFTSAAFYEDRLHAAPDCERRRLIGPAPFDGAGLWYLPVEHWGCANRSPEEVGVVERLVQRLLDGGTRWSNHQGQAHPLRPEDILVVAPYNAQVSALSERLPGLRIGTVDKFQGQEAPVVIVSMTTSSAEDAPRGMEFIYSPNRLNVATSRAQCAVVLVASPRLFQPECRTPRQMRLANAFCQLLEYARVVTER